MADRPRSCARFFSNVLTISSGLPSASAVFLLWVKSVNWRAQKEDSKGGQIMPLSG